MTKGNGLPCKKCGTSDWYDSGNCRFCQNERVKAWQKKNPDKIRSWSKRWEEANKETKRATSRRWYRKHREREIIRSVAWKKENPLKNSASENRRRARKSGNGGSYTDQEFLDLCDKYGNVCVNCLASGKLTADHVIPVTWGGSGNIENIQPLCLPCNASKGNRHATDYRTNFASPLDI